MLHADARDAELPSADGVVTSPPYPGLIDYHEQHRYAYELLGLDDRRELEVGARRQGRASRPLPPTSTEPPRCLPTSALPSRDAPPS